MQLATAFISTTDYLEGEKTSPLPDNLWLK